MKHIIDNYELKVGSTYLFYYPKYEKCFYIMELVDILSEGLHPFIGDYHFEYQSRMLYSKGSKHLSYCTYYSAEPTTLLKSAEIFELTDDEFLNIVALNI